MIQRLLVVALLATPALAFPVQAQNAASEGSTNASAFESENVKTGTGAALNVPVGWSQSRRDGALTFTAPEGDAKFVIVGVTDSRDAGEAVRRAWADYDPDFDRPVALSQDIPSREGWDAVHVVNYETSPSEKLVVQAYASLKHGTWTVVLIDGAVSTFAKRGAQIDQSLGSLRPLEYERDDYRGATAHQLTAERITELKGFVEEAIDALDIPGVGFALIDNNKIVYEGGLGTRDVDRGLPVDENTHFMIGSNTKGMATLLLSTLADDGKLRWDQKVTELYPDFKLGSPEVTDRVLVEHLVCACTGLPRKDLEWAVNTSPDTLANETFVQLAATEPTSGFGEVYQYNNLMASAAGYLGGYLAEPELAKEDLGRAFDVAIQKRVFDPLHLEATTFDFDEAMEANWAKPYAVGLSGAVEDAPMDWNKMIYPYRPAGGAWSTAHDMALYALNELNRGQLADGSRLVSEQNLLKRRQPNVPTGENSYYGMGLMGDTSLGILVIEHGGATIGYKSNFWVLPDHGVGAVLLTNSDTGQALLGPFKRKLLEVLFDAPEQAADDLAAGVQLSKESHEKARENIVEFGDANVIAGLASNYANANLGPLTLEREGKRTFIRLTTGRAEIATRRSADGTDSLVMVTPGLFGIPLTVGELGGKRTLTLRDPQHEYVFIEEVG